MPGLALVNDADSRIHRDGGSFVLGGIVDHQHLEALAGERLLRDPLQQAAQGLRSIAHRDDDA